jgi:hypothetical protein
MFEEHPVFHAPDDASIYVWRCIYLPKYNSLLNDKALYFGSVDKLIDQFEGSLPRPNILVRSADPYFRIIVQSSDGRVETAEEPMARSSQIARTQAFVNCWHMNKHESAAMWQLYGSSTQGIAIWSTYQGCANHSGIIPVTSMSVS